MPSFPGTLIPPQLATAPSSPVVGQMYYDTATNRLYWWDSTQWVPAMDAGGTALTGEWTWTTSTGTGSVAPGQVGIDTAAWNTATMIRVHKTTNLGTDASNFLMTKMSVGDELYIQQKDDSTRWARYTVKTAPVDNTTWVSIPVTWVKDGTTLPANNRPMLFSDLGSGGGGGGGVTEVVIGPSTPVRNQQTIWVDTDEAPAVGYSTAMDTLHLVGAAGEPAFQNSWANTGSGDPLCFRKTPEGKVYIRGSIVGGASATTAFTLPVGYRPASRAGNPPFLNPLLVTNGVAGGYLAVYSDGRVQPNWPAGAGTCYLDVEFDTESVTSVASSVAIPMDTWHLIGNPGEPTFQNSFAQRAGGDPVGFRKYPDGRVRLKGFMTAGTVGATVFTLPAGYRPLVGSRRFPCIAYTGSAYAIADAEIDTSGNLAIPGAYASLTSGSGYIDLSGIEYDTETVANYVAGALPGVYVQSYTINGPWPKTVSVTLPFKADVLIDQVATAFASAVGVTGQYTTWDGANQANVGGYFFNEASSHKPIATRNVVRGAAAGVHTLGVANGSNLTSDANDNCMWSVTMVQVN